MSYKTLTDAVIAFRKYANIETLETVVARKLERPCNLSDEIMILSAADHRRAEILACRNFDAGKVPAHVWGLL